MRKSKKAKHGRSKEKRTDCPLIVLALVVNSEGFIKYSTTYEGNKADSKTLIDMITHLRLATSELTKRAIVVIDAGIATEENLAALRENNYDYVCISRSKFKEYSSIQGTDSVFTEDKKKQKIELKRVNLNNQKDNEYYRECPVKVKN